MIAFDLDGVLLDLFPIIDEEIAKKGDLCIRGKDYRITTENGMSNTQIWKCIEKAYARAEDLKPFPGALECITLTWEITQKPVKIVTARPSWSASDTLKAIEHNFGTNIPFQIAFAHHSHGKLPYLVDELYFVEDRRFNAKELANAGKTVFLVDTHYNGIEGGWPGVIRIDNLYKLSEFILAGLLEWRKAS